MAKKTWLAWVGDLPKLSQTSPLQTVHFPSVQQDDLPLAASLALVSSHTEYQETAAARASAFLWRKQRAVAKGSHSSSPQHGPFLGLGAQLLTDLAHWITPALPATFWLCVTSAPADNKEGLGPLSLEKYVSWLHAILWH